MAKQPRLGDDAYIYQAHKEKSERAKLHDMTWRGRLAYLWEYYRIHAFITIIILIIISYFVHAILNPGPSTAFYAAVINNTIDDKILDQYSEEFAGDLHLNPKKEIVNLNYSYNFKADADTSVTMQQVLVAHVQAREVDVVIAPESAFKNYAKNGLFCELSDQLPTDIYSSLTNDFFLSDTEDNKDKKVYGVYLTDTTLFHTNADNSDPYILGIVANSSHKENSVEFIKYLFEEK